MDARRSVRSLRIAFDSNVLLYLALVHRAPGDRKKADVAAEMLVRLREDVDRMVPYQALGECFHVMARYGYERERARAVVLEWTYSFQPVVGTVASFETALELATSHKLQFWDALIMAVAAEAQCRLFLSEDLQPGFTWNGLTVVDPFAGKLDDRLARLLEPA